MLEVEEAALSETLCSLLVHCKSAAGLLEVTHEGINHVVLLMVQIFGAKQRLACQLGDVDDDVKQLAKLDCQILVNKVFDGALGFTNIVSCVSCTHSDKLVKVKCQVDHNPERQVHLLLLKSTGAYHCLKHWQ